MIIHSCLGPSIQLSRLCDRVSVVMQVDVGTPVQASINQVPLLTDLCRAMFTGSEPGSGPLRSGIGGRVSEASDGVITDAMAAIKEVMKQCTRKGRRLCGPECAVHQQCLQLDKEEMLGYMMGNLFGLPRLPQPYARSVGETARLRGVKVAPGIDAAERRLRKASSSAAPELADQLRRMRGNVSVELEFPSRQLCVASLPPRPEPTPEPVPDESQPDADIVAWLGKRGQTDVSAHRMQCRARAVHRRLWQPRGAQERALLFSRLATDRNRNNMCSCADPRVPSWLCYVASCWSTAAGCVCSERQTCLPGEMFCTCMCGAWSVPNENGPSEAPTPIDGRNKLCEYESLRHRSDPPPGGQFGQNLSADEAAASVSNEELSSWCLRHGYPDPYDTGRSFMIPGYGRYWIEHATLNLWPA